MSWSEDVAATLLILAGLAMMGMIVWKRWND